MWAAPHLLARQGPPPKPKLSADEARRHAEDMVRKAKERREVRALPPNPKPTLCPAAWPASL
jgi:hypothetical protein